MDSWVKTGKHPESLKYNRPPGGASTRIDPNSFFPSVGEGAVFNKHVGESNSGKSPRTMLIEHKRAAGYTPNPQRRSASPGPPPSIGGRQTASEGIRGPGDPNHGKYSQQDGKASVVDFKAQEDGMPLVFDLPNARSERGSRGVTPRRGRPMEANAAFDAMDVNGDGVISREEFRQAVDSGVVRSSPVMAQDVIYPPGHEAEMAERMRRRVNVMKKKTGPPPSNPAPAI